MNRYIFFVFVLCLGCSDPALTMKETVQAYEVAIKAVRDYCETNFTSLSWIQDCDDCKYERSGNGIKVSGVAAAKHSLRDRDEKVVALDLEFTCYVVENEDGIFNVSRTQVKVTP